jgi:hypothetical protein
LASIAKFAAGALRRHAGVIKPFFRRGFSPADFFVLMQCFADFPAA